MPWSALADAVLVLHAAVVAFVVAGLPLAVLGNRLGWAWANRRGWRLAHLAAIGLVALQAWLGQHCVLTLLESALRRRAGAAPYEGSFIAHWLQRLLFFDAPMWAFTVAYTAFAAAVALAWWRYPPGSPPRSSRAARLGSPAASRPGSPPAASRAAAGPV